MEDEVYDEIFAIEEAHWWFRGRRAVIHALLARVDLPHPARILDAGCGTGRNMLEFADLGRITGVEPSASAVEFCHTHGLTDVVQSEVEHLPFAAETFDGLFAFDVLEHLDDDIAGMRELRRVAKDGATFVATVPAYRWLWSQHDDTHQHRRRYTLPMLRTNAEAAGWRPTVITYFNSLLLPPIAAVRAFRHNRVSDSGKSDYEMTGSLNGLLEKPMQLEAKAIRHGMRLPAGVSVAMVCRPA